MTEHEIEMAMKEIESLDDRIQDAYDAAVAADSTILYDQKRFSEVAAELRKERVNLWRQVRLNKTPQFRPIADYGDRMPIEEFISCVNTGGFIDYDGFGHYVRDDQESDIDVYPSDVKHGLRTDFTEIIWFNR